MKAHPLLFSPEPNVLKDPNLSYHQSVVHHWRIKDRILTIGERTLVMGILNVTPDSFSDGGRFFSRDKAIEHAQQMINEGDDNIDVGGEYTRPGNEGPVSIED